jgi:hypothetical protein
MNTDDDERYGAASDLGFASAGERERAIREVSERIAAAAAQRAARPVPGERRAARDAPPPTQDGATLRSPPAWVARQGGPEHSPAPIPNHAPPASRGPVAQAPAFHKNTVPLPALSPEALAKGGAVPFRPAQEAKPPPQRRAAPRTVQSRVVGMGGTTPVGDDSIERAAAAIRSPLSSPPLTLRQFASLCAELAFQPNGRPEILERYGVRDEAVLTALDAHWRRERAARPEARTAFADDFACHLAWLHAHWA